MMGARMSTVTRRHIASAVALKSAMPLSEVDDLVVQVLREVTESIVRREGVMLSGFGKFLIVRRNPRAGRDMWRAREVVIPPRWAVVFRASKSWNSSASVNKHVETVAPLVDECLASSSSA